LKRSSANRQIYLADLGLAICSAALLVNLLLAIVDLDT
jgi:ABC-type nickel/cobalt efflux system permease component RcnA